MFFKITTPKLCISLMEKTTLLYYKMTVVTSVEFNPKFSSEKTAIVGTITYYFECRRLHR